MNLNETELDALTELVNIGVSRAAANLARMAGEEVVLTVPAISAVTPKQAADMVGGARAGALISVQETFRGDISGRANLVFPASNSLELARAVTQDLLDDGELLQIADEAVLETGNIVLQACLSTMANMLQRTLQISVPQLIRGSAEDLFEASSAASVVLFVYINFHLRGRRIRGYIVLAMDLPSQERLKVLLGELVDRAVQGS